MIHPTSQGQEPRFPDDVRELDRLLSSIRFEPRASLGPELQGWLRRGGEPPERRERHLWQILQLGAITLALCLAIFLLWATLLRTAHGQVVVDQCCFELDGGGVADDGVLVEADPDESVQRLTIYEDLDGSRSFTEGDIVRFARGAAPVLQEPLDLALSAFHHCCLDYDGGGKADDGVLVLGVPPDRIVLAGIYDTRKSGDSPTVPGTVRPALR
jgi:hypothetical protein